MSIRFADRNKALALAFLLAIATISLVASTQPRHYPYTAQPVRARLLPVFESAWRGTPYALADADGDGRDELFLNVPQGITLCDHTGKNHLVIDQINLPPAYASNEPFADLAAPIDIDGDGRSEVIATAPRQDGGDWRLWVLDIEEQRIEGEVALPIFSERRPDGFWDGYYIPIGAINVPGRTGPCVVLTCLVGHDVDGRGVLVADPVAGEIVWRHEMGALPVVGETRLADLDGDGWQEIAMTTRSPNNLHGERINGASDDSCYVFVFEASGKLRWYRALAGSGSSAHLDVGDLNGDGRQEIATVASEGRNVEGRLSLWSADGRACYDRIFRGRRLHGICISSRADGRPPRANVADDSGFVESYVWSGDVFELLASRQFRNDLVLVAADDVVIDRPGEELCFAGRDEHVVTNADLEILATIPSDGGRVGRGFVTWRPGPDFEVLSIPGQQPAGYQFTRTPRNWSLAWISGALAAVFGTGTVFWTRRHNFEICVETDPAILRELRLQLLARLAKGNHEKIGALRSLRRLVWRLNASVSLGADGDTLGGAARSIHETSAQIRDDTLTRLEDILSLAFRTGVRPHVIAICRDALRDIDALLADVEQDGTMTTELQRRAEMLARESEFAFQKLRREVEAGFSTSLPAAVARVLAAQNDALVHGDIEVNLPRSEETLVAMDSQDLDFILDNLVGNAIRAMDGASTRRLAVEWRVAGQVIHCLITDTGLGIAPEDRELIFEDGHSDRPGGGYGLARSRRDLHIYGGDLRILDSQPGKGTTFELTLPVASHRDQQREVST